MTATRVWPIAAVAAVLALLLFALLFFLLSRGGGEAVELTGAAPVAAADTDAGLAGEPPPAAVAEPLRVYVAGAVQKPGVYTLNPGDRLADAVAAAGGIAATADLSPVNLALKVQDEGRYLIPDIAARPDRAPPAAKPIAADLTRKTANLLTGELSGATESLDQNPADKEPAADNNAAAGNGGVIPSNAVSRAYANSGDGITVSVIGLLDLNTATDRQLQALPGIGPSRARAIIAHRNQHGPFVAAEELTAVAGIGPGIYGNLQSLISVAPAP